MLSILLALGLKRSFTDVFLIGSYLISGIRRVHIFADEETGSVGQ